MLGRERLFSSYWATSWGIILKGGETATGVGWAFLSSCWPAVRDCQGTRAPRFSSSSPRDLRV